MQRGNADAFLGEAALGDGSVARSAPAIMHRRARVGDTGLHLTSLEQSLLYLLTANAGRLLTRDEILGYLWGTDYGAASNVIDRHIRNLRVKLHNGTRRLRYTVTIPAADIRACSIHRTRLTALLKPFNDGTS